MSQSFEHAEFGARIWDRIVDMDREKISDGEFLLIAKEFKDEYLKNCTSDEDYSPEKIESAWEIWKTRDIRKDC